MVVETDAHDIGPHANSFRDARRDQIMIFLAEVGIKVFQPRAPVGERKAYAINVTTRIFRMRAATP